MKIEVKDILSAAKAIPTPKPYRPLHEYGEAIHIMLHEKRMTYRSIAEWFSSYGLEYTASHFSNAYAKWCALNPKKAVQRYGSE